MRHKCRIWWPKQAVLHKPSSNYVLFGWFITSSLESVDVVVAFVTPETSLPRNRSQLLEDLHRTNASMPSFLQDETVFSPLGLFLGDPDDIFPHPRVSLNHEEATILSHNTNYQSGQDTLEEINSRYTCNCKVTGKSLFRSFSLGKQKWIRLVCGSHIDIHGANHLMPKFHHIHWDGKIICNSDVHVIFYDVPTFGVYHLLSSFVVCSEKRFTGLIMPNWLSELNNKMPLTGLDTAIHAINCAASAISVFHRSAHSKRRLKILSAVAFVLASCSATFYIVLQLFHWLLDCASCWRLYGMLAKVFQSTRISISIRCSQFLYWPVYIGDGNFRSHSSVEYAEKSALQRHSLWTSMIVDILLGNVIGLALLISVESVRIWVFGLCSEITNNLLRSGCVWLMGVPAGFKLNTELAAVLGMISLNAIQIWSALWFSIALIFEDVLRWLAVLGMIFGMTTIAAFINDVTNLAVFHVTALHWALSLIYSWQIQSIASLWRLFRGQKWNPLRQRFDNYDYSVEQHIVGSLLFTPLLLLLPTTSVFYIFFSLVSASMCALCLLIEVMMTVINATPYLKILLWITNSRRFAAGLWFEILPCGENLSHRLLNNWRVPKNSKSSDVGTCFTTLVTQLHSNCLTFREIVLPHYRRAFSGVSPTFFASAARGLFTGERFPNTLCAGFPAKLPWYSISFKEYWHLCYESIAASSKDGHI